MAKADRLARLDVQREELEGEYAATLVAALRSTASGKPGLFGRTADRRVRAAIAPVLDQLTGIAADIDTARSQLGMPPYDLHARFLAARGPVGPEAVGETKEAQAWLERVG